MNLKKNLFFISTILCILISLSAVTANENTTPIASIDTTHNNDLTLEATSEDLTTNPELSTNLNSNQNPTKKPDTDDDEKAINIEDNKNDKTTDKALNSKKDKETNEVLKSDHKTYKNSVHTSIIIDSKKLYKDKTYAIRIYVNGLYESVGYVDLYINGNYINSKNVENGIATFSLTPNYYNLGNSKYYAYYSGGNSSTETYYHPSQSNEATILVKAKAKITANKYNSYYNSGKPYTIKVENTVTGKGDMNTKIKITLYKNNKKIDSKTVTTDSNGIYRRTIRKKPGTYKILVKMTNKYYTYKQITFTVKVRKAKVKLKAYKNSCWEGHKSLLYATVNDKKGNPVKTGTIYFKFRMYKTKVKNGVNYYTVKFKTYKAKVHNGVAHKYVKLGVGTHKYTASYHDKNYYLKYAHSKVKVSYYTMITAYNKVIKAPKYKTYKITLTKGKKAIKSTMVTLKLGKYTFKAKTSKKGIATFKMRYSKISKTERSKTYKVTAKVIKNKNLKILKNNKISLNVDGKTYTLKTTKKGFAVFKAKKPVSIRNYYVTLKTSSGIRISKVPLILKVNSKKYTATTNAKGTGLFKINNLNKNAKFKVIITYAGAGNYNPATKTTYITIKDR